MSEKKILILGLGYIGLPLFLILKSKKLNVIGYDIDSTKILLLKKKKFIFNEKPLHNLYNKLNKNKNLTFVNKFVRSDVYIICVPTPVKKNKKFDNIYIEQCFNKIIKNLKNNDLIIIESTCPPNTTEKLFNRIKKERSDLFKKKITSIKIAYCPETIMPGNTIQELINNYKIIGGINSASNIAAKKIYNSFNSNIISTSSNIAELVKLSQNAYRDVNIAFANEISNISKKYNASIVELIKLSNLHPRVNIHNPSIGVGGHCIPVDPWFLINNYNKTNLIKTSRQINDKMPTTFYNKLRNYIIEFKNKKSLSVINIAFLGLTYKNDIGDFRGSPSLEIVSKFFKNKKPKYNFKINDPFIEKKIKINNQYFLNTNIKKIYDWSDFIIIFVYHSVYKKNKYINKYQNKIILPYDL